MTRAISKKLRFEIFKRDGFTCQYCGAHPPDVVLELDHIIAVAHLGTNDEDNLVTACFDCNRGKGARALDNVPKSLAERAEEIADREAQLAGYHAILEAARERLERDIWRVVKAWEGEERTSQDRYQSIKIFVTRLGVHEVLDAIDIAVASRCPAHRMWKYFCGVCWNKIKEGGL